jgi:hypothetical protein
MRKIFISGAWVWASLTSCKKSFCRFFIIELFSLIGLAAHAQDEVMAVILKEILPNKIKLLSPTK